MANAKISIILETIDKASDNLKEVTKNLEKMVDRGAGTRELASGIEAVEKAQGALSAALKKGSDALLENKGKNNELIDSLEGVVHKYGVFLGKNEQMVAGLIRSAKAGDGLMGAIKAMGFSISGTTVAIGATVTALAALVAGSIAVSNSFSKWALDADNAAEVTDEAKRVAQEYVDTIAQLKEKVAGWFDPVVSKWQDIKMAITEATTAAIQFYALGKPVEGYSPYQLGSGAGAFQTPTGASTMGYGFGAGKMMGQPGFGGGYDFVDAPTPFQYNNPYNLATNVNQYGGVGVSGIGAVYGGGAQGGDFALRWLKATQAAEEYEKTQDSIMTKTNQMGVSFAYAYQKGSDAIEEQKQELEDYKAMLVTWAPQRIKQIEEELSKMEDTEANLKKRKALENELMILQTEGWENSNSEVKKMEGNLKNLEDALTKTQQNFVLDMKKMELAADGVFDDNDMVEYLNLAHSLGQIGDEAYIAALKALGLDATLKNLPAEIRSKYIIDIIYNGNIPAWMIPGSGVMLEGTDGDGGGGGSGGVVDEPVDPKPTGGGGTSSWGGGSFGDGRKNLFHEGGDFSGYGIVGDDPGGGWNDTTELVYAPFGARVFSNKESRRILGGGSGGGIPRLAMGGAIGDSEITLSRQSIDALTESLAHKLAPFL